MSLKLQEGILMAVNLVLGKRLLFHFYLQIMVLGHRA